METTVTLGISLHWVNGLITFFVKQTACFFKLALTLRKIIVVHKVVTRIVRRVNIYHFYLAKISLA